MFIFDVLSGRVNSSNLLSVVIFNVIPQKTKAKIVTNKFPLNSWKLAKSNINNFAHPFYEFFRTHSTNFWFISKSLDPICRWSFSSCKNNHLDSSAVTYNIFFDKKDQKRRYQHEFDFSNLKLTSEPDERRWRSTRITIFWYFNQW
jgi:hypothetical protein